MRIEKVKLYKFDELSEEVRESVIEKNRNINVGYSWWDIYLEDLSVELEKVGVLYEDVSFDLGRGQYIYLIKASVEDTRKFLKAGGIDLRTKEAREIINYNGIDIQTNYHGGGNGENYVSTGFSGIDEALTDLLDEILYTFLRKLDDAYFSLISDEEIAETLRINEYEFMEDGTMWIK